MSGVEQTGQGIRYGILGPRLFNYPNPLSGTDMGYYWIRAEALVG
jgi:hypothetical protein